MQINTPILITGVTGYIGSRITIDLLNKGYAVRGTMRNTSKAEKITKAIAAHAPTDRLTLVNADLLDAASWLPAVEGCEFIMHVASPFYTSIPKDPNDLILPAREGTLNVLKAATKNRVKKVVLTSSIAAIAYGLDETPSQPITEDAWSDPSHHDSTAYINSKTLAEKAAWDYINNTPGAPEMVAVHPGAVLGPSISDNTSESLKIISKIMNGEFPGIPKFGFMLVDVRDVSDLHIRAMLAPNTHGERFIATTEFHSIHQIVQVLKENFPAYQRKLPSWTLPNWLLKIAALFDSETKGVLMELPLRRYTSNQKAKDQLGWLPRPIADTIRDTANGLIAQGLV